MAKPKRSDLEKFLALRKASPSGPDVVALDRDLERVGLSLADLGRPVRFTTATGRPGLFWRTDPVLVVANGKTVLLLKPTASPARVAAYLERGFWR